MIFVITWLFDHFTLKPIPSVNGVWIITFIKQLHAWVTKFKPLLMFLKLLILAPNNVIWANFSTILFDKIQNVVKTHTAGYLSVCFEIINLFIEPQNFLLIFFLCKLKGFYVIVTACDALLMLSFTLFNSCIKPTWYDTFQDVLLKCCTLVFSRVYSDIKSTSQRDENIMTLSVFPRGVHTMDPPAQTPLSLKEDQDLISSSDNLEVNVMIRAIPRYCPVCALLKQFCSSLSTSTSMSLRLNSSDLLLPLEIFNTEDIFFIISGPGKVILDLRVGADQHFCVNKELASLHFAQNYPSSVSKTLQSWCRALKVFYQTSLLPLCNVFCHVYEKSLK